MEYLIQLAILFVIYAILAVSLNLIVGYTGLVSVAHAAFFGIGTYTTAILLTDYNFNFFSSLILGILLSAFISFLVGAVFSRFSGDYYVVATIGFKVIVYVTLLNWVSLTHGPLGIPGIAKPKILGITFSNSLSFLLLISAFLLIIYLCSQFIVKSSFGRVLKAIREDEKAIEIFGYRTSFYKLIIFIIGASMAAIAGSFFASYITFIDPSTFMVTESVYILSIIILGGLANLRGSLLGALILVLLPELLRFVGFPSDIAAQLRQLIYGLALVFLMLYRPQGLIGEYKL